MQQLKGRFFIHPAFVWVLIVVTFTAMLPLSWMYLLLMTLFIMPPLFVWLAFDQQKLWAPVALAIIFAAFCKTTNALYGLVAIIYLLPISICVWLCVQKEVSLLKSMFFSVVTYGTTLLVFTLIIRSIWGVQAFDLAGIYAVEKMQGISYLDEVLYLLLSNGFLSQEGLLDGAPIFVEGVQGIVLTQAARSELLMQMQSIITQYLSLLLPTMLISYNILLSSAGLAFAQSYSKTGYILPQSVPFSRWQPLPESRKFWWVVVLVYLLGLMGEGSLGYTLAYLNQAILTVFTVLGLSFLALVTRKMRSKNLRFVFLLLAYFIFTPLIGIIGFTDWVSNLKYKVLATQALNNKEDLLS
jgi:hypothetical protein